MSEPVSEPANDTAAAVSRAKSLVSQFGDRLKETGAKIQGASLPHPGAHPAAAAAGGSVPEGRPATERAEQTLDRAGEQLGVFAAALSHRVRRSVALAREETEDIWAEAQSLRRNNPL